VAFALSHGGVERLTITRSPLYLSSCRFPRLAELTFDDAVWAEELVAAVPRLHVLDLTLGGTIKEARLPPQIDTIRIASPRGEAERALLRARLERFPDVTFEVASEVYEPDHPRLRRWKRQTIWP